MRLAHVWDVREHPLLDANLDERCEKRRCHLYYTPRRVSVCTIEQTMQEDKEPTDKRRPWRYFDVVAQLKILYERERLSKRLDRVALEELCRAVVSQSR